MVWMPARRSRSVVAGPTPGMTRDLHRPQQVALGAGRHHRQSVGLVELAGDLGDELRRADADTSRSARRWPRRPARGGFRRTPRRWRPPGRAARPAPRSTKASSRESGSTRGDAARRTAITWALRLAVGVETAGEEGGVRAAGPGLAGGHRRADAEGAGLVGRGGDHAPPADAADDHGLAAQGGLVALLDGGEEGVEVEVQDRSGAPHGSSPAVPRHVRHCRSPQSVHRQPLRLASSTGVATGSDGCRCRLGSVIAHDHFTSRPPSDDGHLSRGPARLRARRHRLPAHAIGRHALGVEGARPFHARIDLPDDEDDVDDVRRGAAAPGPPARHQQGRLRGLRRRHRRRRRDRLVACTRASPTPASRSSSCSASTTGSTSRCFPAAARRPTAASRSRSGTTRSPSSRCSAAGSRTASREALAATLAADPVGAAGGRRIASTTAAPLAAAAMRPSIARTPRRGPPTPPDVVAGAGPVTGPARPARRGVALAHARRPPGPTSSSGATSCGGPRRSWCRGRPRCWPSLPGWRARGRSPGVPSTAPGPWRPQHSLAGLVAEMLTSATSPDLWEVIGRRGIRGRGRLIPFAVSPTAARAWLSSRHGRRGGAAGVLARGPHAVPGEGAPQPRRLRPNAARGALRHRRSDDRPRGRAQPRRRQGRPGAEERRGAGGDRVTGVPDRAGPVQHRDQRRAGHAARGRADHLRGEPAPIAQRRGDARPPRSGHTR